MNRSQLVNIHINGDGSPRPLPPIDVNRASMGTPTSHQPYLDRQKIKSLEILDLEENSCSSSESEFEEEMTPFIPRTSVFNGKMEFSSDEEDSNAIVPEPTLANPTDANASIAKLWQDISLDGKESACISGEGLDVENLRSLVGAFTIDTWKTCLTSDQRDELRKLLPNLSGWKGLSEEDALEENLRCLFAGENFNFGNQLDQLCTEIIAGTRTTQVYRERKKLIKRQRRQYLLHRHQITQKLLQDIFKHRAYYIGDDTEVESTGDKSDEDMDSFASYTAITNKQFGKRVDPSSSLFLAIADYMKNSAEEAVKIDDVWDFLQNEKLASISFHSGIPVYLDTKDFVESILRFLAQPLGANPSKICEGHDSICDVPCVEYDKANDRYIWKGGNREYISEQLLLLEQFFMTQSNSRVKATSQFGSAMKAAHKRARKIVEAEAIEDVSKRPSVVEAEEVSKRAKSFLRETSVPTHPEQMGIASLELFQAQERERYRQPTRAYTFLDPSTGVRATVGPTFAVVPGTETAPFLAAERPSAASLLNLVRDAAARLPGRSGTRADIRNLLKHSQYCLNGTPNDLLDVAVVGALNVLSEAPDPCIIFQPRYGKWMYLHGDRPTERFDEISRSVQTGGAPNRPSGYAFSSQPQGHPYSGESAYYGASQQHYANKAAAGNMNNNASSGDDDSSIGSHSGGE